MDPWKRAHTHHASLHAEQRLSFTLVTPQLAHALLSLLSNSSGSAAAIVLYRRQSTVVKRRHTRHLELPLADLMAKSARFQRAFPLPMIDRSGRTLYRTSGSHALVIDREVSVLHNASSARAGSSVGRFKRRK